MYKRVDVLQIQACGGGGWQRNKNSPRRKGHPGLPSWLAPTRYVLCLKMRKSSLKLPFATPSYSRLLRHFRLSRFADCLSCWRSRSLTKFHLGSLSMFNVSFDSSMRPVPSSQLTPVFFLQAQPGRESGC